MAKNVEIKARVSDWNKIREQAAKMAGAPARELEQEDIFYRVAGGRLKLRIENGRAELIYYVRPNEEGPRESEYMVLPVQDAGVARRLLAQMHGERGIVRKKRWLYLAGQTRIHLDRVDRLGDFLELEVVLRHGQGLEEGALIARDLMKRLGVEEGELIDRAYVDLLEQV